MHGTKTSSFTNRRFKDGDHAPRPWQEEIFTADESHKCPTYVHQTPPCQGSCPAGEDIRGWLNITRGLEKAPEDVDWREYAFTRLTESNPFPSVMGRVCPAPCETGCNRNALEEQVGINSVEQFLGDHALSEGFKFDAVTAETGKKVAIVGGGPAGLSCAYHLRRMGHACTLFERQPKLGGMMRYGIPGYRMPREALDGEIDRILDLGVEVRANTKIGVDIAMETLEADFDAVFFCIGTQTGAILPVDGADAPNCLSGVAFLEAFNNGRLQYAAERVVVIGGGDTAMDVAAVAKRLGHVADGPDTDRVDAIVHGDGCHDEAAAEKRAHCQVLVACRESREEMPASDMEVAHVTQEGVEIRGSFVPVNVVVGADGRATAIRLVEVEWDGTKMETRPGTEIEIECDVIVWAIGQSCDFTGNEVFRTERGFAAADSFYRLQGKENVFVGGDVIRPHLLTTAIGHGSIAAEGIDNFLRGEQPSARPRIDVHHFDLTSKLHEAGLDPTEYDHVQRRGTSSESYAIHNYEDRSAVEVANPDALFLGHFAYEERRKRGESRTNADNVLGFFDERIEGLSEEQVREEADRCMSCGLCFECDNCVIYCPQDAVFRVKKSEQTMGRYVDTDYTRCIGCHICADVCPTGYIKMGLGE
jgi:glutamate synthase (NADPH) small chain